MSVTREFKEIKKDRDIYYPQSIDEIKKLIQYASSKHLLIRTLGSEHSPSSSIYSSAKSQIKMKLDGKLNLINRFEVDECKEFALVNVGAGCYLGVNPSDSHSTLENSFNYQVHARGFALPMLGGISHQTIAGFLSTSSSGGTGKHTIADVIQEIGFVDGLGQYRRVKKGEDLFNALGVSMGLLGVITDVTFKLPKKYLVAGDEVNQEMKDSCLAPDCKGDYSALKEVLFDANEYAHINWFAQKYVNRVSLWRGQAVENDKPITPYYHALSSKGLALLASDILLTSNILNETFGNTEPVQKIIAGMTKVFVPLGEKGEQHFCDEWYKALPIDDQAPVDGLIDTSFSELWFQKEDTNEVMNKLNQLFEKNPKAAGNLIVELYCAKESPFWMSPAYQHDMLRLDLYWWNHNVIGNANQYFGQFYEALKDIPSLRFHWGKHLPHPGEKYGDYTFSSEHLQKQYPKLADFLALREKMDPAQIFVTDYWQQLLNIPKPWRILEMSRYIPGLNLFSKKSMADPVAVDQSPSPQIM